MPYKKTSQTLSFEEIAANARAQSGISSINTDDQFKTHFPNSNVSIKIKLPHFKANNTTVNDNSTHQKTTVKPKPNHDNPMTTSEKPKLATETSNINIEIVEKPEVDSEKPKTATEKPKTATEKPKTATEKPKTATEKPKTAPEKPLTDAKKPKTATEKRVVDSEKPKTDAEKPLTDAEKPKTAPEKPKTAPEKPLTATEKPLTDAKKHKTAFEKPKEVETSINNGSNMNLTHFQAQKPAQFNTVATDSITDDFINSLSIKPIFKKQIIDALEVSRRIQTPPPTTHFISSISPNNSNSININTGGNKGNTFTPTILIDSNKTKPAKQVKIESPINEEPIVQTVKNPSKIKTKICTFFLKGECTKGDNCTFIHNEQVAQSTQNVKDTSKDIGNVIPPLCRYGQSCTHLANGECKFGHYKSIVMSFNLARKLVGLASVKTGVIYPDIRHNETHKKLASLNNNKQQTVAVK